MYNGQVPVLVGFIFPSSVPGETTRDSTSIRTGTACTTFFIIRRSTRYTQGKVREKNLCVG
jgi:hypothetical protein